MTEVEVSQISTYLTTKKLNKDDHLLKAGHICNFIAFVHIGKFRSYYTSPKGDSVNIMLNSENEFIGDLESFITLKPSNLCIQAIEESEIIIILKEDIEKLYDKSLYWNSFGRIMTENTFIIAKRRLEDLLYQTPENRYLGLLTREPEFLNQYPLTDIASYLGITLQSLSRIRSRISIKNRS